MGMGVLQCELVRGRLVSVKGQSAPGHVLMIWLVGKSACCPPPQLKYKVVYRP